jgi:hypothetical protein
VSSRATCAAIALLWIPGLGASLVAHASSVPRLSVPLRLATVFGYGYSTTAAIAYALALAGVLDTRSFLLAVSIMSAILWLAAIRRQAVRWPALPTDDCAVLVAGMLIMVALGVLLLRFDPILNLGTAGRWRYWADALETADAGAIPAHSFQWGATYPATVSKVLLNSFSAGFSLLGGRAVLPAYGALLWISLLGWATALWALGWELGLRRLAPLLPLVSLAAVHVPFSSLVFYDRATSDESVYQAEDVGRMIATCAAALAVHSLRTRGRPELIGAVLMFAAAAGTHLIPTLVMFSLVGIYGTTAAVIQRDRRPLVAATAVGVGTVILIASVWAAAGATLGLGGVRGDAAYRPRQGLDPTALFAHIRRSFGYADDHRFYVAPSKLVHDFGTDAIGIPLRPLMLVALSLATLLLAVVLAWRQRSDLRPLPIAAWLMTALLVVGALVFSHGSRVYITGTFGDRRLFEYSALPVFLYGLAAAEEAVSRLGRVRPWLPSWVGVITVALAAAVTLPGLHPEESLRARAMSMAAKIEIVNETIPCNVQMLVNHPSNGLFEVFSGRVSVLEGSAPYLRPAELDDVLAQIAAARAFLRDPVANAGFLRRERISYVVLFDDGPGDATSLTASGLTRLVHSDDGVKILRVSDAPESPPRNRPGYRCVSSAFR